MWSTYLLASPCSEWHRSFEGFVHPSRRLEHGTPRAELSMIEILASLLVVIKSLFHPLTRHNSESSQRLMLVITRLFSAILLVSVINPQIKPPSNHLGFDRNIYPGDAAMGELRKTFSFTGYWLNAPPGATSSSWMGKRKLLRDKGFGFLVLSNGRTYAQLKKGDPRALGMADGKEAARLAEVEGFPAKSILFLDQEEGGRLLPEQRSYLHAWVDAVIKAGYAAGVYCSGMASKEAGGASVVTARDIRENAGGRKIEFFVANDECPPASGCVLIAPRVESNGVEFATVWQFAQTPRRKQYTASCARTYAKDGSCYAGNIFVDLDVATSVDPSRGR
jgi:hypothetical protein